MTNADIIPVQNILTITFAALVISTYIDTAIDGLKDIVYCHYLRQLQAMALGLVMLATGTILLQLFSFGIHELGLGWLRNTWLPVTGIGAQGTGFLVLGVGFFLPRSSGARPENRRQARILRRGSITAGIAFLTLSAIKCFW